MCMLDHWRLGKKNLCRKIDIKFFFLRLLLFIYLLIFYLYCPSLNAFLFCFDFLYSSPSSGVYQRFALLIIIIIIIEIYTENYRLFKSFSLNFNFFLLHTLWTNMFEKT